DRRPANRSSTEARHHAERWLSYGPQCVEDIRIRTRSAHRRDIYTVSKDAQRRCLRRLYGGHQALPEFSHPDRTAGRIWTWTHHRRLPSRAALWRGEIDSTQGAGKAQSRFVDVNG